MLNESIHYKEGQLYCDDIAVRDIIEAVRTPVYIYSANRIKANIQRIKDAFQKLNPHIHYSAKANANLALLQIVRACGAGVDAVSAGEIYRALQAGICGEDIVFAGVGKTPDEIEYAISHDIGWFNVENVAECNFIETAASKHQKCVKVALRLNPDVTANTHPYIATGHGGAKFGLTAETVQGLLQRQQDYPHIEFAGIHIHIGSQLHDIEATREAITKAIDLIRPYPSIRTVNIGGGLPVPYTQDDQLPDFETFADGIYDLLRDYTVLLEPGRSIIADAGFLVTKILYLKKQAGQTIVIADASMTELIRPALYEATHEVVPVVQSDGSTFKTTVVGPVCETADVLAKETLLPAMKEDDAVAILTAGAYGMVMSSNYNARLRPAEVLVEEDGQSWRIIRKRETWEDLTRLEEF